MLAPVSDGAVNEVHVVQEELVTVTLLRFTHKLAAFAEDEIRDLSAKSLQNFQLSVTLMAQLSTNYSRNAEPSDSLRDEEATSFLQLKSLDELKN